MVYRVFIYSKATKALERLPIDLQIRVRRAIDNLADDLAGDVKKLSQFQPAFRLRVGDYRVLFDILKDEIHIKKIAHRRDVYDRP